MGRPKKIGGALIKTIPLRLDEATIAAVKHAADKLKKADIEVIRDAIRIGLADLKAINYDVAGVVAERALALVTLPMPLVIGSQIQDLPRAAETAEEYKVKPRKK